MAIGCLKLGAFHLEEAAQAGKQRDLLEHQRIPYRWVSYDEKERSGWRATWREHIGMAEARPIEPERAPAGAGDKAAAWIAEAFRFVLVMTAIKSA